ncbi:hypothetical protein [Streptomyces sp. NPDC056491]|uniref:hypothetical protein n=1 Tax=Streptomyces sp. NPDC056491 TaxID=3345837 RepID=UPI003674B60C
MNAVAALQLLIAVAFLSIPVVRSRYGARAQAAVEAELGRQGVRTTVMTENGLRSRRGEEAGPLPSWPEVSPC